MEGPATQNTIDYPTRRRVECECPATERSESATDSYTKSRTPDRTGENADDLASAVFDAIRFRHWNSSYNLDSRDLWSYLGSDDHLVDLSWVDVVSLSLVLTGADTGGSKGKCTRRNKGIIYDVSIVFEARRNTMKEPGDYS